MIQYKLTLVLLLLMGSISSPYCALGEDEGTKVGGVIRKNTIWTKENSPYILQDDITIRPGITLKIQEGVTVEFSLWSMIVNGQLQVTGTNEERIDFHYTSMPLTSYRDARIVFTDKSKPYKNDGRGNRLEYLDIFCGENTVNNGLIDGGTITIDHLTVYDSHPYSKHYTVCTNGSVTNSLFIRSARPLRMCNGDIVNNHFINSTSTVITLGDGRIKNNLIVGGRKGIVIQNGLVLNNTIKGIEDQGINMQNHPISLASLNTSDKTRPILSKNLILNCAGNAVYISGNTRPTIINNVFLENVNGIYFNEHEIYNDNKPKIYNNLFYNNENNVYFDRLDPRIEIKIQNNWWGTTDTKLIEDKIYYENDDPRLLAALYRPIKTELPYFLPKIPFELTLTHSTQENNEILVTGTVYPPLEKYELTLRYIHPDGQRVERIVSIDHEGVFNDVFTPNAVGSWEVTVENEFLGSKTLFTQEMPNLDGTVIEENIPETIIVEENNPVADETSSGQIEIVVNLFSEEPTTGEETVNETTIKIDDADKTVQVEKDVTNQDPLFFGFIPSIVSLVMLVAVYIGVNGIKSRPSSF